MTVTGADIVARAKTHLGQHESPMGSNTGAFVESCQRCTFLAGTGWPWCAAFVCKVAKQCGVPLAYNGAGAHDLADHHQATAQTVATAQPGDVCDWNVGSGHTSILVSKQGSSWTTIDGNWGDQVSETNHPVMELRKVWRIPGVSGAPAPPPRKRLPVFTVATSQHGQRKILFRARTKAGLTDWLIHHTLTRLAPNGITITRPKGK